VTPVAFGRSLVAGLMHFKSQKCTAGGDTQAIVLHIGHKITIELTGAALSARIYRNVCIPHRAVPIDNGLIDTLERVPPSANAALVRGVLIRRRNWPGGCRAGKCAGIVRLPLANVLPLATVNRLSPITVLRLGVP
jgi:hypothetical protein